jgi:recombinational DNA repair ATPase RecF
MVKLKRLKIGKYRNVKPGTELRFRDSLNVLLGRNGTGKTTLLNLMVQFQTWASDRTALDEVPKPKEAVCLGAAHNLELASHGLPAREVRAAGKSFAATVEALSQDAELCAALARTYSIE